MNVAHLREDFPILHQTVNGRPLAYLDNAATTQKPRAVLDALEHFYAFDNANVHRAVHTLAGRATQAYEDARAGVARFLNATSPHEIVFVRGTTEAINLVAQSYARPRIGPGDAVLVTEMEHHSNIVPWQLVCAQTGAELRHIPIDDRGALDLTHLDALLDERVKVLAVGHASNALGTINPLSTLVARAHAVGAVVVADGAQAVSHLRVDVRALDVDFYAFSGHKVYGPTGIGALYGKRALLHGMPPWQGGGEMINEVRFSGSTWADPPARFEAGTPHISGAIGLHAALRYLEGLDRDAVASHEGALLSQAAAQVAALPGVRLIGTAAEKIGVLAFHVEGVHPHDVGTILDAEGVAVRAGQHCAQPVMDHFGLPATVRASFALYNTPAEIDALTRGLERALKMFR